MEKQAAWACGTLLYEVAMLDEPFDSYPTGGHSEADLEEPDWEGLEEETLAAFVGIVRGLLQYKPAARISLESALLAMQELRPM